MKRRVWKPIEVLVYGRDRYVIQRDGSVFEKVNGALRRVHDGERISVAYQQLAYDHYRRRAMKGEWPEGQPRPVRPHLPGERPFVEHELERAIARTRQV